MSEITRETTTTQEHHHTPVAQTSTKRVVKTKMANSKYAEQLVYFVLSILEVLLSFRFVLKLTGASQASSFVKFIYNLSRIFIFPFEGIFRRAVSAGMETVSIIEPATIVAIIVYAVLAWGIVSLIHVIFREAQTE